MRTALLASTAAIAIESLALARQQQQGAQLYGAGVFSTGAYELRRPSISTNVERGSRSAHEAPGSARPTADQLRQMISSPGNGLGDTWRVSMREVHAIAGITR